jgi:hypothetical protein
LFVQAGLGLLQHRIFRRTKQETMFGIVHRFLGPLAIVLALVNGGLGLDLAGMLILSCSLCTKLWLTLSRRFALHRCVWRCRRGDRSYVSCDTGPEQILSAT